MLKNTKLFCSFELYSTLCCLSFWH